MLGLVTRLMCIVGIKKEGIKKGRYQKRKVGISVTQMAPGSYPSTISGLGVPSDSLCNVISVCNK